MSPGDAGALGAFIIAAIALWHSVRTERRRAALEQLVLEEKTEERADRLRAHIVGRVELTERSAKIVLLNEHGASAQDLKISPSYAAMPDVSAVHSRSEHLLYVESLPVRREWIVPLNIHSAYCAPPLQVDLEWIDGTGERRADTLLLSW